MKKVPLTFSVFTALHQAIVEQFKSEYPDAGSKDYQLYGYNTEDANQPSIRNAVIDKYRKAGKLKDFELHFRKDKKSPAPYNYKFNGKYLRDVKEVRFREPGTTKVDFNKGYLDAFLFYLGYEDFVSFVEDIYAEGRIDLLQKAEQLRELGITVEDGQAEEYSVFYYDSKLCQARRATLKVTGEQVAMTGTPDGYTYEGTIDLCRRDTHTTLALYSIDHDGVKKTLYLTIPDKRFPSYKGILTGFYLLVSGKMAVGGTIVIEHSLVDKKLEEKSSDLKEKFPFSTPDDLLQTIELTREDERGVFKDFFSDPDLTGRISQPDDILGAITRHKQECYTQILRGQKFFSYHPFVNSYHSLRSFLNRPPHEGWESNLAVTQALAGDYMLYVGCWEKNEFTGERERKIEQVWLRFNENNTAEFTTSGAGEFTGTFEVIDQRIAHCRFDKAGSYSRYYLILVLPAAELIRKKTHNEPLFLRGILGGISINLNPRTDKVYLRRLINNEELDGERNQPRYLGFNNEDDAKLIKEFENEYPGFKQFFSLQAEDEFIKNSNLFYNNFLATSLSHIENCMGAYSYYRLNIDGSTIKKYPFVISRDGEVRLRRNKFEMRGKAFVYGKCAVLMFYDEKYNRFDGCFVLLLDSNNTQGDTNLGFLVGLSDRNEPFSNLILFRLEEKGSVDPIEYLKNNKPQVFDLRENQTLESPQRMIFSYLLSKESNLFSNVKDIGKLMEEDKKEDFPKQARQKAAQDLVSALLFPADDWDSADDHFDVLIDKALLVGCSYDDIGTYLDKLDSAKINAEWMNKLKQSFPEAGVGNGVHKKENMKMAEVPQA